MILAPESLSELSAAQLRELLDRLMGDLRHKQAIIDKLTHENAMLKRLKFAAQSERFSPEQRSLLEESLDADLQAVAEELEQLAPPVADKSPAKQQPKRQPLPAHLPRREIRHDPESTTCACGCQLKRIGEDVSEKLDIIPAKFFVHRHIYGKWACKCCQQLRQEPAEPDVIDAASRLPAWWRTP